ncbi:dTDP-4-dehydrorhamnose reductase [Sphingomonas naasensis]|uniref:dTDP-4-dehydrorhamnose reductase n=1 Tax=Sphingomonas naasensis TaxID=1344951 RepID=A0A4S1WVP8_9SPHN|nr:SDR family oxidoreductase [Sphingomonas naasensis]NIJ19313.1 dTDP-4-dehydrorhamnose reductase [Sphingomonas naasensis]TGX46487.1 SDR family oxidoreductase [Sphingomonas naasensis]
MRILVLGATGMLGNAMARLLAEDADLEIIAATRSREAARHFSATLPLRFIGDVDAEAPDSLVRIFAAAQPDVVVNCVGLVKQIEDSKSVMAAVPINTLLPHRLAELCKATGARLIHISTDCVFSGTAGNYRESDRPDASDVYGLSKYLGEVSAPHAITLRTSIIGHELRGGLSLLEWFLGQNGSVKGFTRAIFSGVPTAELARIVRVYVLPRLDLSGLYHVSAAPITKYELLRLIAAEYGKQIEIVPDDRLVIDRSLDSTRFREATGYMPPAWPDMIRDMHDFG